MSKRDQIPPYEIMRSRAGGHGATETPDSPPMPAREPVRPLTVSGSRAPWWVGSSAPLVIRLPRGLAIIILLGLLLLIVVAYGVGAARGAAAAKPKNTEVGIMDRPAPGGYFVAPPEQDPDGGGADSSVDVPEKPEVGDQREVGLNYMRLVQSTEQDCRELAAFFGARGVAIQLVPVHNGRFFIAYAVKRGYRGDELGSEACKRYEQQLRSIGRQWKASNGGRGTDLSTMYFERYDG